MDYEEIIIAPSILAADFTRLGEQIKEAETGGAGWLHLDVMDGRFVPNISFGIPIINAIRQITDLPLDVHLMIVEPDHLIPAFVDAGADHITVHYEACVDLYRTLSIIKRLGCKAGVALNPATRAAALYEVITMIDQVVMMTVSPGFGGQPLIEETLPKFARMHSMAAEKQHPIPIIADGGINFETANAVVQADANVLVAGSAIFNDQPIKDNIAALRDSLSSNDG